MIHIATAHHRDSTWIRAQVQQLRRHTGEPFRLYGSLYGIAPEFREEFDFVLEHGGRHTDDHANWTNMNRLGRAMVDAADPEELIVFLHGDAFPVAEWTPSAREWLAGAPLAAVQRRENMEPVPHECFCVTTAGFWEEVDGAWGRGPEWESDGRMVTDTAATLWRNLEERGVQWRPILRTNAVDLHPLWFAVYGDVVYHHGAGFRPTISRRDAADYSHLPFPLRNLAGIRRRWANEWLSRRIRRRVLEDPDWPLTLVRGGTA